MLPALLLFENNIAGALNKLIISGKRVEKLTEIERNIVTAWVETLKVTEVNIHDKFFESGGNSLLASYLHKEIDKFYPNIMVITDIFVYSSIEEIANFIELKMKETEELEQIVEEDATEIEDMVAKFMNGDINLDELDAMIDI